MRQTKIWLGGLVTGALMANGCETTSRSRVPEHIPIADSVTSLSHSAQVVPESDTKNGISQVQSTVPVDTVQIGVAVPNIDLCTALELARVGNPTINLAREATREAEAFQTAADALKLPSLNAGINYNLHRGSLLNPRGTILDVNRQGLNFGQGAGAVGASTTVIPGVRLVYPLTDIISEPRIAGQRVSARLADANAVENTTLLDVATSYLDLLRSDALIVELKRTEADYAEVVRLTEAFAKAGQGRIADVNRAKGNAELLQRQLVDILGERTAASARLAGILSLDPTARLISPGGSLYPLQLIDANAALESLVAQAESNRPELLAQTNEITMARLRVRQEQIRPWLPTLSAGYSVGGFGGGSNLTTSEFSRFGTRSDFDVAAVWSVQNLGFGNRAIINRNRSVMSQAVSRLEDTRNRIRSEVAEARAQVIASETQIETARRQLTTAEEGYRQEATRIQQGAGLPLELLDSTRSLMESRLELVRAITEFNMAQFRLLAAVGTSPGCVPLPPK